MVKMMEVEKKYVKTAIIVLFNYLKKNIVWTENI